LSEGLAAGGKCFLSASETRIPATKMRESREMVCFTSILTWGNEFGDMPLKV
jgi:hypothetical protein